MYMCGCKNGYVTSVVGSTIWVTICSTLICGPFSGRFLRGGCHSFLYYSMDKIMINGDAYRNFYFHVFFCCYCHCHCHCYCHCYYRYVPTHITKKVYPKLCSNCFHLWFWASGRISSLCIGSIIAQLLLFQVPTLAMLSVFQEFLSILAIVRIFWNAVRSRTE